MATKLFSQHFMDYVSLANFLNVKGLQIGDILKIDADASNGGWVVWWYETV